MNRGTDSCAMTPERRAEILIAFTRRARTFDLVAAKQQSRPSWPPDPVLSRRGDRQAQVLALIAKGLSNEEIAADLHVSVQTVKTHVRRMLAALGARNRAHAVAIGFSRGMLDA